MSEKSIKVYHYSNKPIQQFENRIGGTWFTDNSYRYPRRRSAEIKHTVEIPKELKLAPAKVANKYLYQGNKELMQVELSKLGYDGVKINVGGDNQYLIFDINKIKPITESIEKVTESTAKQAYKGALKKGEGVADIDKIKRLFTSKNAETLEKGFILPDGTIIGKPNKGHGDVAKSILGLKSNSDEVNAVMDFIKKTDAVRFSNEMGELSTHIPEKMTESQWNSVARISKQNKNPNIYYDIIKKGGGLESGEVGKLWELKNIHSAINPIVAESAAESTAKTAYKGLLKKGLKGALITGGGMALGALMSPPVQAAQTILENPEEANPVPEYGTLHSQVEQPYLYTNKVQNQVGLPNGQMPNPANYNIDVRKQAYKNMRSKW